MINLLPPQKLANIRIARANTTLRRYIELLLLALLVVVAAIIAAHYLLRAQQANVESVAEANKATIAELEPVQKQAEQLSETINTIATISSRDVQFSEMLVKIGGLMPGGAVLTGLQVSVDDFSSPLVITAEVDNEAKGAILLNNIKSSDIFKDAELKSITKIETETDTTSATATSTTTDPAATPATTTEPVPESPYRYTVVIDAYFKQAKEQKR